MKEDAIYNKELEDYIFIDDTKNDKEAISKNLGLKVSKADQIDDPILTETINQWVNQWRDIHTLYQDPA
jgi:hypothetical protein